MYTLNMCGIYPNMYSNWAAMSDLTDFGMMPSLNYPMMPMNSSIFSPMPGMPFLGGTNFNSYYKNYEQYQNFMTDNMVKQQQNWRNADLRLNSPQEGINKQASYLREKIMRNEQEQIPEAYSRFKESVRNLYINANEQQVSDRANTMYSQITGKSLIDDIRENGRDSFTQGLLQSLTFGLADSKTAEENISQLTGMPMGRTERMKKTAGNAIGGAILGSAGAIALSALWKIKNPLAKALCKIPVLAAIGGVIAGVLSLSKSEV